MEEKNMPRKGENIYKRKDGRWEARYIYAFKEDGSPRYRSIYAADYLTVKKKQNDAKRKIVLNNESLMCSDSIETYSSSEAYDKNLIKVVSNTSMFDIKEFKTFELRKLNLIGFTVKAKENGKIVVPEALCQVVSKDLLANYVNIGGVTPYCQRNLYELKLVDEDYELNIKYGVIIDEKNKALTEGSGKVVVDLVVKKTSVTEKKDVESILHKFHEILFDAFCWCVSDEFKKILG